MSDYELLPFDSGLMGFPVARITAARGAVSETTLQAVRDGGARLAYWMIDAEDKASKQLATHLGGALVDRKLTYSRRLDAPSEKTAKTGAPGVEPWGQPSATPELVGLALLAGEYSRFRLDPKIPGGVFESLYRTWIEKSVSQELAKETLVVRQGNEVAGFITLGEKQGCGDIGLVAVAEKHRGRGIGSKLVQAALGWFSGQRHSRARVATQGANRTACALYERHGFGLEAAEDVFHFWIE